MVLADINFGDVFWSMVAFFFFVIILWMIFGIIGDIFRSRDLSGGAKALWCIFIIVLPWLAIFIYLIARGHGMSERATRANQPVRAETDASIRAPGGSNGATGEITDAKALLDSGAIDQDEFNRIKASALAGV
jgi:hypothetical protein